MWKCLISAKFGEEILGCNSRGDRGSFGVDLWKEILESSWIKDNSTFRVGKATKIRFWFDTWCSSFALNLSFPELYAIEVNKGETVVDVWDWKLEPQFCQGLQSLGAGHVGKLLNDLQKVKVTSELNRVSWSGADSFSVRATYKMSAGICGSFLIVAIFVPVQKSQSIIFFFIVLWSPFSGKLFLQLLGLIGFSLR